MSQYIVDDREMPKFRVDRAVMVDPDVFAREKELIFDRCWLYVGHETELAKPNDFRTRTVGGRPVIFFRDSKGVIRVWVNSCPHRGATLCREPSGNARFMTCFYHGWSFSNAGKLVSLPDDESYGPDFDRPGLAAPAQVDSYRGFVFATFDPEAPDLRTYLAGAADYLDLVCDQSNEGMRVLAGTHEYSAKANWKLLVENSFDGYHAVTTHQRYFEMAIAARSGSEGDAVRARATGAGSTNTLVQSRGIDLGNGHAVTAGSPVTGGIFGRPLTPAGQAEREKRFRGFAETYGEAWVDRMRGTRNLVIFPNLVVIDLVMGVVIRKIDPVSPDYMEVSAWHLAPPDEGPELHRQRLDNFLTFWGPGGLASPDDVEALETCQRSFASRGELRYSDISRGMNKERPTGSDEFQMRTWWRRWNVIVTGEELPPEEHAPLDGVWAGTRRDPADTTTSAPATAG
ncbi:aromatic-ring-hydroxylating dioxygenase subunit alpha [Pseudonocardia halophobica]|uniref:Aromatic-ring-hydroxylating dioxygenase subunit alpha n=1 Tax=Pseudonocardia halophobica TaxID=29401 RepID=A0A9W6UFR2_9PSEU|nr:aromatic ring-hydroxylating dioxygenase subunit alpha [Pseudonocardia halophobica]GLL15534.1 aromatic-ring-hydroxylating dioxygenase subunit alpha [Pseudonocardia halophobica]